MGKNFPRKSDLAKLSVEKKTAQRQSLHLNRPNLTSGVWPLSEHATPRGMIDQHPDPQLTLCTIEKPHSHC